VFIPNFLIVCNQLPLDEKFYPLLVFAEGNKLEAFIEKGIDLDLQVYVKYLVRLQAGKVADYMNKTGRGGIITAAQRKGHSALMKVIEEIINEDINAGEFSEEDRNRYERLIITMRKGVGEENFFRSVAANTSPKTVVEELDPKELGMKRIIQMARTLNPTITAAEIEKLIKEETEGDEKAEK
jgi:hypothetical protein